jgi:tetratricopeptide (TPR) repeat protein
MKSTKQDTQMHDHGDEPHREHEAACSCGHHEGPVLSRSARLLILLEVLAVAILAGRPLIARSTYNRAASFYTLRMPDRALKYCRKTLALSPDHADTWELIAYCQDMKGGQAEALRSFDIATRLDPHLASAYFESGLLMVRLGKYRDAVARFRETAAIEPENLIAARFPILCFAALGEKEKAIKECRLVLRRFPDDEVARRWARKLASDKTGSASFSSD